MEHMDMWLFQMSWLSTCHATVSLTPSSVEHTSLKSNIICYIICHAEVNTLFIMTIYIYLWAICTFCYVSVNWFCCNLSLLVDINIIRHHISWYNIMLIADTLSRVLNFTLFNNEWWGKMLKKVIIAIEHLSLFITMFILTQDCDILFRVC